MEKAFEPYVDGSTNTVIKVVGVGGAGGNALNTMVTKLTDCQVEFIAANTDRQALTRSLASEKISLGRTGLGAGARPEVGFQAANDAREEIAEKLRGADMVFITAGMGGGTGTGASPVIAEVAQELGILTVAVVTKPFSFEGGKRMRNAELGLNQLKNRVHSLIVILNDKLEEELGEDATMRECFEKADEVLFNACAGIAELIQKVGQINLDFEDVRTVMGTRGTAMMGSGEAEGPDRAVTAASMAVTCPLLEGVELRGAKGLLVNITAQEGIRMSEVRSAMETIKNYADSDALIVFGTVYDDSMGDKVRVTVIATGLDQNGTDDSIVKTSFVNGKPAVDNPSNLWQPSGSAPDSLPNDLFGNIDAPAKPKVHASAAPRTASSFAQPQPHPAAAPAHTAAPAAPAAKSEVKAEEVKAEVNPFGSYTPQPQKKAEPAPAPKAESKEPQPEAINPFGQAFSRPIATPDAGAFEGPKDNTIFGNFHASNNIRPASDVFATLNPQAGNGNDSGLWTANQPNGAPEAKGQGAAEVKAEDEKPRFEYGIPAFLRKKN